jgi:hypothetical protein
MSNHLIPSRKLQTPALFWSWWVLINAVTVAGVTAIALTVDYLPPAVIGWIGVGVSLGFIQHQMINRCTRLDYWGWATGLGWLVGVPIGKLAIGWEAAGWDLDWALAGLCIGFFQALALQQQFSQAGWWLLASTSGLVLAGALGGATGLLEDWLAYKGLILFDESLAGVMGWTLAALAGGAVYGAITGGWLLWFMQARQKGTNEA